MMNLMRRSGRARALVWGAALAALAIGGLGRAPRHGRAEGAAAVVGPEPEDAMVAFGATTDVVIAVHDVQDLYGADVQLSFDPGIVEVVDADPVTSGTQMELLTGFLQPDWVLRNVADNQAGTIWYAVAHVQPRPPVSGSGNLARITFRAVQPGWSALSVTYRLLATRTGGTIETTPRDGRITVTVNGMTVTPSAAPSGTVPATATRPPTLTPTPYYRDTETPGPSPTALGTPGGPDRRTTYLPYTFKPRRAR